MNTNPLTELVEFLRRLYRDSDNGWIFGVCAGLADHFRVNVVGVRLLALVLAWFVTLPTVIIYVVLALLMRDRPLIYRGGSDERHFWSCRTTQEADNDPSGQS
jgi:phage shock protein PspC (stress-responsive transcriptional regulator)